MCYCLNYMFRKNMLAEVEETVSACLNTSKLEETTIEKITSLKRRANERIAELARSIIPASPKRSKCDVDAVNVYISLVKTFKPLIWNLSDVTPRELATRGWKCVGVNMVECNSCHQFVSTSVPTILDVDFDVYSKCLSRLRKQLVQSHESTCPYKSVVVDFHCKNSSSDIMIAISTILSTYTSSTFAGLDVSGASQSGLDVALFPDSSVASLFCAILNWKQLDVSTMSCDLCARQVMLSSDVPFDPVTSHYKWCPVLDIDSQGIAYWRKAVQIFSSSHKEKVHRTLSSPVCAEVSQAKKLIRSSVSVLSLNENCG